MVFRLTDLTMLPFWRGGGGKAYYALGKAYYTLGKAYYALGKV